MCSQRLDIFFTEVVKNTLFEVSFKNAHININNTIIK